MHGQTVCKMHGGKSPQALAKAEQRMRELIHPAIASLERQIKANEFPAARYVLDWAGFKATEKIESDAEVVVRVVHEDQPLLTLDVPYAPRNGHVET
jgi:hypothetical protein